MLFMRTIHHSLLRLLQRLGLCAPPEVFYIGGSDTMPAPLDRAQEQAAIQALSEGSAEAASLLIEHNLRLVVYIARRFENTGVGIEDLISIGTIGLIKAINTFNAGKNIKLATYASRCIENEILMHLRKINSQKTEVSIDEPLNTDWDGNELLLSDILGTDEDEVSRPLEDDAAPSTRSMTATARLFFFASASGRSRRPRKRRWPTRWASRKATSAVWKNASSRGCAARC